MPDSGASGTSVGRSITTLLLLIVFQLPIVGWLVPGKSFGAQMGGEAIFWAMALVVLSYVVLGERRPLSSIGLKRPTWKTLALGLSAGLLLIAGAGVCYLLVFPALGIDLGRAAGGMAAVQSTPLWFWILLVSRAAVFEEIFYRGFAIERLSEITGMRSLAALLSLAAFTLAHLGYWGWAPLIVVALQGGILTGLYLLRRDLASNMLAHFVFDAAAFLSA